jgi:hypothetical protein
MENRTMQEANEVAATLRERWNLSGGKTMCEARAFVRGEMPGESYTVVDNVAWSLVSEPPADVAELRAGVR